MARPRGPRWIRRLAALFTWDARDRDMDQEMAFHVDALARDYEREGMTRNDAARAAARRFGDVRRLKERGHDVRTSPTLENVLRDARHALRGLRHSPGFSLTVVLSHGS